VAVPIHKQPILGRLFKRRVGAAVRLEFRQLRQIDRQLVGRNRAHQARAIAVSVELVQDGTPHSPRRSVWILEEKTLARESQGALDADESVWKVVSSTRRNFLGYPTGYTLESHGHAEPLMHPADFRRAAFIGHDLWITAYAADELYASGETPNQNPGRPGLPQYQRNNESIRDADIVLWHTLTFHHVTVAEDYPVLSREHGSFELIPSHFFDHNPALDLRRAPFEVP
jgi:primary-amine oxidase